MLLQIISRTPPGVWVLLFVLVGFGLQQARDRSLGVLRAAGVPLVLLVLSLAGVLSTFGTRLVPVLGWAVGAGSAVALARRWVAPREANWCAATSRLHVPASWLPLVLMLSLFTTKYVAGVSLALHPALVGDDGFGLACSLAYGAFAGVFMARAVALWQLTRTRPQADRVFSRTTATASNAGQLG